MSFPIGYRCNVIEKVHAKVNLSNLQSRIVAANSVSRSCTLYFTSNLLKSFFGKLFFPMGGDNSFTNFSYYLCDAILVALIIDVTLTQYSYVDNLRSKGKGLTCDLEGFNSNRGATFVGSILN